MADNKNNKGETPKANDEGDRIAKVMARAGVASRREAERMIEAGRVRVNGEQILSPALNVTGADRIEVDGKQVTGITYSAYAEMADKVISEIREEAFEKFTLRCLHVYHSIGMVPVGEMSLLVMVSSAHRGPVFPSLEWIVEQCKHRLPIWKQEHFDDGSHRWIGDAPA